MKKLIIVLSVLVLTAPAFAEEWNWPQKLLIHSESKDHLADTIIKGMTETGMTLTNETRSTLVFTTTTGTQSFGESLASSLVTPGLFNSMTKYELVTFTIVAADDDGYLVTLNNEGVLNPGSPYERRIPYAGQRHLKTQAVFLYAIKAKEENDPNSITKAIEILSNDKKLKKNMASDIAAFEAARQALTLKLENETLSSPGVKRDRNEYCSQFATLKSGELVSYPAECAP